LTNDTKRFWTELVLILPMLAVKLFINPVCSARMLLACTKLAVRVLEVVRFPEKVPSVHVIVLAN